jgi:hypothetical protein
MVCLILRLDSPADLLLRTPNMPAKSKTRVPFLERRATCEQH